jgi:predicted DNA-binding transcriptional regulator YafY
MKQKEENKTVSIFRLLAYLIRGNASSISLLKQKLNIPERTLRRYLKEDLPNMGFEIEKDSKVFGIVLLLIAPFRN